MRSAHQSIFESTVIARSPSAEGRRGNLVVCATEREDEILRGVYTERSECAQNDEYELPLFVEEGEAAKPQGAVEVQDTSCRSFRGRIRGVP